MASSAAKCSPTRSRRGTGLRRASAVQVFDLDPTRTRHGRSTDGVVDVMVVITFRQRRTKSGCAALARVIDARKTPKGCTGATRRRGKPLNTVIKQLGEDRY